MGRKRVINADLPEHLFFKHGAYYYVALQGKKSVWEHMGFNKERAIEKANKLNNVTRAVRWSIFSRTHKVAAEIRKKIFGNDSHCCFYCGSKEELGLDHFVSHANGGSSLPFNLIICCIRCNTSKGNRHPGDYILDIVGATDKIFGLVYQDFLDNPASMRLDKF